jgi:hypothetical protein
MPVTPGVYLEAAPAISSAQVGGIDEFKSIVIVGTSATGGNNLLTDIVSYDDFRTKFGTTSPLDLHIKMLFANNPQLSVQQPNQRYRVKFVKGFDTGGSPTPTTHLTAGLNYLNGLDEVPLGFLLCPEAFTVATPADTTTLYELIDDVCEAKGLLGLVDFRTTANTAALISTAADGYRLGKRSTAAYWGYNRDGATDIPLSVIVAAQAVRQFDEFGQFTPPAGRYAIANPNPQPRLLTRADQEIVYGKQVNFAKRVMSSANAYNDVVWGAKTMATDPALGCPDINTCIASIVTERSVQRNIEVFKSVGFSSVQIELKSTVSQRLIELSDANAFKQDVVLTNEIVLNTASGLQRLSKGTTIPRGYVVFEPQIVGNKAYIDFVYFPVTTLEQVIIRTSRVII